MNEQQTYIALLRGINVGGHHKVPMADLRTEMGKMGFRNVKTLLNSGNVIFDATDSGEKELEEKAAAHLESVFGFPIPVLIRNASGITDLLDADPFANIEVTKDIRLYVSFLKNAEYPGLDLPWISEDQSFRIIDIRDRAVCSVLDVSITKTPKGMDDLGKLFDETMTTRNWNTVRRIAAKLEPGS